MSKPFKAFLFGIILGTILGYSIAKLMERKAVPARVASYLVNYVT